MPSKLCYGAAFLIFWGLALKIVSTTDKVDLVLLAFGFVALGLLLNGWAGPNIVITRHED